MFWGPKNQKNAPSPIPNKPQERTVPQGGRGEEEFNAATIIAEGTYINGRIEVKNHKIFIDGRVDGAIEADHLVIIGDKGEVGHRLRGDRTVVSGKFNGNMDCEWIEIEAGGEIVGEVFSNQLVVKPRGIFEGRSRLKNPIPKLEFGQSFSKKKQGDEVATPSVAVEQIKAVENVVE